MVVDVVTLDPTPMRISVPTLSGSGHVSQSGYLQERIVAYYWMNEAEKNVWVTDPTFGLDAMFPPSEGWTYTPQQPAPIETTLHLFNATVTGQRYLSQLEAEQARNTL